MRKQQKDRQPKRKPSARKGRLAVALEVIEALSPIICALIVARLIKWEWE